jgi:hypothetical protein
LIASTAIRSEPCAVIMITKGAGVWEDRSSLRNSNPLVPGKFTSSNIKSGGLFGIIARAALTDSASAIS